jgi:hypothetical protein
MTDPISPFKVTLEGAVLQCDAVHKIVHLSPNSSLGAEVQRHIALQTVLVVKDEALQRDGFDYADRRPPAPTLSPWLICLTGSAM